MLLHVGHKQGALATRLFIKHARPHHPGNTDHTTSGSDVSTFPCNSATTASANVLPVSVIGAGASVASPTLTAPSGYTIRSTGGSPYYEAVSIADAAGVASSGTVYGTGSWTIGSPRP